MKRVVLAISLAILIAAAYAGLRGGGTQPVVISGQAMGMGYRITLRTPPSSITIKALATAVRERLETVETQISTWRPDSQVSLFNQCETDEWFPVERPVAKLVDMAQRLSASSGGAFDVTVGPLVDLWGFGPAGRRTEPPTEEQIAAARLRVGYEKLQVRLDPPALRKTRGDVHVDLSAIGEGYAVEKLAELLDRRGIADYLVEISGEQKARGVSHLGKPWRIGLEAPLEHDRAIRRVIELTDLALATSGSYRNYFKQAGRRYSHIIDPHTGRPVEHNLVAVTVAHRSAIDADGLATAIMALGPEAGYNFAVRNGVAALLVTCDEHDVLTERTTPGFTPLLTTK